jgi:hypothetical protein
MARNAVLTVRMDSGADRTEILRAIDTAGAFFVVKLELTPELGAANERSCLLEARRLHREPRFAGVLHFVKSLTPSGRDWLRDVVVYATVERREAAPGRGLAGNQ